MIAFDDEDMPALLLGPFLLDAVVGRLFIPPDLAGWG